MNSSKTWTTVTPLSKLLALILFIAMPFLGFWLGLSVGGDGNSLPQPLPILSNKDQCNNEGCSFIIGSNRGGYGSLRGYFVKGTENLSGKIYNCDQIIISQSSAALDMINGNYLGGMKLNLELGNLSAEIRSKILNSNEEKPVELFVFWPSLKGTENQGCTPSPFEIIRVS